MIINGMGRTFDHVRVVQFEMKWQQRKIESVEPNTEQSGNAKDSYISTFMKQNAEIQKASALQFITGKLKAGKRLSYSELEFLRNNAPDLYVKALKIEKEREEYRRALKNCKTKEDVRRLQAMKSLQLQTEAKPAPGSVRGKEKEDERQEFIAMRMMAMLDEYKTFINSREYKRIPSENDEKEEDEAQGNGKNEGKNKNKRRIREVHILGEEQNRRMLFLREAAHEHRLHGSRNPNNSNTSNSRASSSTSERSGKTE